MTEDTDWSFLDGLAISTVPDGEPPASEPLPYYVENPPITATVVAATGMSSMVCNMPAVDLPGALEPSDIGWLRGDMFWVGDGERLTLVEGGYSVDPETREITLL